jgi:N-methylhydantoinase A/oxoprolinase/acetone carboxylase beta subunit
LAQVPAISMTDMDGLNPAFRATLATSCPIAADGAGAAASPPRLFRGRVARRFRRPRHRPGERGGRRGHSYSAAIRLAVANIVRAVEAVSTERGRDPRDYALLPFGGAGPLLAAEVAEELGVTEMIVPPNPGVISAFGLLAADDVRIAGITRRCRPDAAVS